MLLQHMQQLITQWLWQCILAQKWILAQKCILPKNELGNYAKRLTTHMCCRFSFPLLQEKFKYNNINEFDFLLLTYEIYKTIFPGFRDMRGHWLRTLSLGAGTILLFYYHSKSKSPPLPRLGGGGVYIDWCITLWYCRHFDLASVHI